MTILGRSEDDTSDADSYVFSGTIPTAVGSGKYTVRRGG